MKDDGSSVCLIKPQFEAGKDRVGKKGVVRDKDVHEDVIKSVIFYARDFGLFPKALSFSPIKGPEGNIEYLLYLRASDSDEISITGGEAFPIASEDSLDETIKKVVDNAHDTLDK